MTLATDLFEPRRTRALRWTAAAVLVAAAHIGCTALALLHWQDDPSHPDYAVVRQIRAVLEQATDAAGRSLEIIELPAPDTLQDEDGFVDWNYANHLVVNGGVIACGYGEADADSRAAGILGEAYGRDVVTIDARPILQRGGGIHCITQQQPASNAR